VLGSGIEIQRPGDATPSHPHLGINVSRRLPPAIQAPRSRRWGQPRHTPAPQSAQ